MPSPSASSKFGLSILKFFKHAQFFMYTQNHFDILKIWISLHKLAHLSIPNIFWVYLKNLSIPQNLTTLKTNFEEADGLGIRYKCISSKFRISIPTRKFLGIRPLQILMIKKVHTYTKNFDQKITVPVRLFRVTYLCTKKR